MYSVFITHILSQLHICFYWTIYQTHANKTLKSISPDSQERWKCFLYSQIYLPIFWFVKEWGTKSYKIIHCNTLPTPSRQKYEHYKRLQAHLTLVQGSPAQFSPFPGTITQATNGASPGARPRNSSAIWMLSPCYPNALLVLSCIASQIWLSGHRPAWRSSFFTKNFISMNPQCWRNYTFSYTCIYTCKKIITEETLH